MDAYKHLLTLLAKMPDVVVSIFSFDDSPHLLGKELDIKSAMGKADRLIFGGKGTNYGRAMETISTLIAKCSYPEYMSCILFFSDGASEAPEEELNKLVEMKKAGKTILLFTIACETEEDDDLRKMAIAMQGDHYQTSSAKALRQIFEKILSLT